MLRRLGGCAFALALLLPAQATASPPSPAHPRAAASDTKSRAVKLGHEPVRTTTADKVRLTFNGRRGQLVNLARIDATEQCGGRVLRTGGKVVRPWAQGFWRLPRTATYTVVNKPCRGRAATLLRLQVRRVVLEDHLRADASVAAGGSTRVTHLVPFRVDAQEQVSLTGALLALVRPDRSIVRDIYTGRGAYLVRDDVGPARYDVPSPRGRYFIELAPRGAASLFVNRLLPAAVDGERVIVPASAARTAATRFVFTGRAGQWIYHDLTSPTGGPPGVQNSQAYVYNTSGGPLEFVPVTCPTSGRGGCAVTPLPADGTYTIYLATGPAPDLSFRVRSALRAPAATLNGPTVTYTAPTPGQWVVGELPELPRDASGGSGATISLTRAAASLGEWRVEAVSGYGTCNPGIGASCYGIHPPNPSQLSPSYPTAPMPWDGFQHPSMAVLAVPHDATGSLDLAVTRPTEEAPR